MTERLPSFSAFPWYVSSTTFWVAGMSLQGMLIPWILLEVLDLSAQAFGVSRFLITVPPLVLLLIGGIWADRVDGKKLLLMLTMLAMVPPLLVGLMVDYVTLWTVIAFGMSLSFLQSLGDPARQAMVNRVTRIDIQRSIAIVTILPSLAGMGAIWLGGQQSMIGLNTAFYILMGSFAFSFISLFGLPALPAESRDTRGGLVSGFKVLLSLPLIRNLVGMHFVSAMFNAGAYAVVVPLIVTKVYEGNSELFALVLMVFTVGSTSSVFLLLLFMPLTWPGRVFAMLQITRALILVGLVFHPAQWLLLVLIGCWGLNMGVTATLVRTTMQELAPPEHRAQFLAVLLFSFMLSTSISPLVLGLIVELTHPFMGLIPGIPISLLLFFWAAKYSGLWGYRSVSMDR